MRRVSVAGSLRIVRRLAVMFSAMTVVGCVADLAEDEASPVPQQATTRPDRAEPPDEAARAMRPFLGRWIVDVDATVEASRALPNERLAAIAADLQFDPFSLEITADRYISRSQRLVRADAYRAIGFEDSGAIVIALTSSNGREPTTAPGQFRSARLLLDGGRLFIGPNNGLTTVLRRQR